jgi:CheY-like chemotaxis protein
MAKVLVVEDDLDLLRQVAARFAAAGYAVETAADGESAVGKLRAGCFDLVVTDIVMPVRDGAEVITTVRQRQPEAKLIAVSGGYRAKAADFLRMALALGADEALAKPFSHDILLEAAHRLLARPPGPLLAEAV